MKIARVFPTKNNMLPTDQDAYFSHPKLNTPFYDEAHISCTFTWDIQKAQNLANQWRRHAKVVRLGGVAIEGESDQPFQSGMYLRKGITITSRGCPNSCSFCMVRRGLIEFDNFPEGNIIQDNNILACSDRHWRLVLSMLKKQKAVEFKGGLEKYRITQKISEDLRGLRIKTLWLACDQPNGIEPLRKAVSILNKAGFTRNHLYCFVLIGDNAKENIHRLREVYKMGCMPFAQLLKNKENNINYPKSWKRFQRRWSKPAIIKSRFPLHPKRRKLLVVSSGIDFLGYIIRQNYILVRRRVVNNLRAKLKQFKHSKVKDFKKLQTVIASYVGHFKHANTYRLKQKLFKELKWLG